jgi:hypothetical protein
VVRSIGTHAFGSRLFWKDISYFILVDGKMQAKKFP